MGAFELVPQPESSQLGGAQATKGAKMACPLAHGQVTEPARQRDWLQLGKGHARAGASQTGACLSSTG